MDTLVLPGPVQAALDALRAEAKRHNLSMAEVLPVTPNQACMWEMSDELHRLRKLVKPEPAPLLDLSQFGC